MVRGDRCRLVEVVQNLVDNAAKFMGDQPQPRVEIGVRSEAGEPVFFVRDNGIGIAPQHRERVFRLFEKLEPASEGTGVGLALVKRIVEAAPRAHLGRALGPARAAPASASRCRGAGRAGDGASHARPTRARKRTSASSSRSIWACCRR